MSLTKNQKEVLHGLALGDLHIELQHKGVKPRLKFEQSNRHKEYLVHLYSLFQDYVSTPPKQRKNGNWYFNTKTHESFRFFYHQYYHRNKENKKKTVPALIHRYLTRISLAYWFMDNGSIKSKESKGVFLNTQDFSLQEVRRLSSVLNTKFGLQSKERPVYESCKKTGINDFRQRKILYHQIYISGHSYERLSYLIESKILDSLKYKFPEPRKKKSEKNCVKGLTILPKE